MKNLTNSKYYANLLLGLEQRFDVKPSAQPLDIERLRAAMNGEVVPMQGEPRDGFVKRSLGAIADALAKVEIKKNAFLRRGEKSIPSLGCHDSYIALPSNRESENIFSEEFDYRKSSPALYSKSIQDSEDVILAKLDDLLLRAEHMGLDADEMKETADLLKKVR